MPDNPRVSFKVENGMFHIAFDPNRNGKAVATFAVDIAEIPSEIASVFKKEEPPVVEVKEEAK